MKFKRLKHVIDVDLHACFDWTAIEEDQERREKKTMTNLWFKDSIHRTK